MTRRRHNPDQILQKLLDMEALQAAGHSMPEIAKRFEVSEQTPHRWRNQLGEMKGEEVKALQRETSEPGPPTASRRASTIGTRRLRAPRLPSRRSGSFVEAVSGKDSE